mmetsp:Transcript_2964/g.4604  ORF Transcript_2964/g.4604 Transcript_2964/m.4604 type:complete len:88 (-) Transcript_2964:135-398(-)
MHHDRREVVYVSQSCADAKKNVAQDLLWQAAVLCFADQSLQRWSFDEFFHKGHFLPPNIHASPVEMDYVLMPQTTKDAQLGHQRLEP